MKMDKNVIADIHKGIGLFDYSAPTKKARTSDHF